MSAQVSPTWRTVLLLVLLGGEGGGGSSIAPLGQMVNTVKWIGPHNLEPTPHTHYTHQFNERVDGEAGW